MTRPPPSIRRAGALDAELQRVALAWALALAPTLDRPRVGSLCLRQLRSWALDAGLSVQLRRVAGRRILVASSGAGPAADDPDFPERSTAAEADEKAIGLWAALRPEPAPLPPSAENDDGAAARDRLVPAGAWSACLALAAAVVTARGGGPRCTAIVELAEPVAADDERADDDLHDDASDDTNDDANDDASAPLDPAQAARWLDALWSRHRLFIAGDGGLPFSDGHHLIVPVVAARRGALWAELSATWPPDVAATAKPSSRSTVDPTLWPPHRQGAAALLVAALRTLPTFAAEPGPMSHAMATAFRAAAAGLAGTDNTWIDDLLDPKRQHQVLAQWGPHERAFVEAMQTQMITITRLDAGDQPDALPTHARAVLDLRAPADRDVEALWPTLAAWAPATTTLRLLAVRPAQALLPPHPFYDALAAALHDAAPIGVLPAQARSEPAELCWRQHGVPVLGFAPAWPGLHFDAERARRTGALAVSDAGLAWGAALFAATVLRLSAD